MMLPNNASVTDVGSNVPLVLLLCKSRAGYKGVQGICEVTVKYILILYSNW